MRFAPIAIMLAGAFATPGVGTNQGRPKMIRMPANGVPWLYWIGEKSWECEACGSRGRQVEFRSVAEFARWLGDVKRKHINCASHDDIWIGIGHPLNPNRQER
jgi:hypothetical protein